MSVSRVLTFIVKEIKEALPSIFFFATGFSLVELTTQLLLVPYRGRGSNYLVIVLGALVVGKAVLLANALPFFRRFDKGPLIRPILFKTLVYWSVVFVLRLAEHLIEYWRAREQAGGLREYRAEHFPWTQFAAVQIWMLVLFLIYSTYAELAALIGEGEVSRLFFTSGPSQMHLTRRQRIKTMLKLTRLTEAHMIAELSDPKSAAHAEMVHLVGELALPGTKRDNSLLAPSSVRPGIGVAARSAKSSDAAHGREPGSLAHR